MSTCPHCDERVPDEPEHWGWMPPWMCSFCSGMYGYGESDTFRIQPDFKPVRHLMNWGQARYWAQFNSGNVPYVYALCYPNGIPFYVGKGRALRLVQHSHQVRCGRAGNEKERILLRLIQEDIGERYAILAMCENDDEALGIEADFIDCWGRRQNAGILANIDGVTRVVSSWCLPSQPAIKANGTKEGTLWVSHIDLTTIKRYSHKGITIICPSCRQRCMHPGNIVLNGARCPHCCCTLDLNGDEVYEYWANNRPKLNETISMVPATLQVPKNRDTRNIKRFWRR